MTDSIRNIALDGLIDQCDRAEALAEYLGGFKEFAVGDTHVRIVGHNKRVVDVEYTKVGSVVANMFTWTVTPAVPDSMEGSLAELSGTVELSDELQHAIATLYGNGLFWMFERIPQRRSPQKAPLPLQSPIAPASEHTAQEQQAATTEITKVIENSTKITKVLEDPTEAEGGERSERGEGDEGAGVLAAAVAAGEPIADCFILHIPIPATTCAQAVQRSLHRLGVYTPEQFSRAIYGLAASRNVGIKDTSEGWHFSDGSFVPLPPAPEQWILQGHYMALEHQYSLPQQQMLFDAHHNQLVTEQQRYPALAIMDEHFQWLPAAKPLLEYARANFIPWILDARVDPVLRVLAAKIFTGLFASVKLPAGIVVFQLPLPAQPDPAVLWEVVHTPGPAGALEAYAQARGVDLDYLRTMQERN